MEENSSTGYDPLKLDPVHLVAGLSKDDLLDAYMMEHNEELLHLFKAEYLAIVPKAIGTIPGTVFMERADSGWRLVLRLKGGNDQLRNLSKKLTAGCDEERVRCALKDIAVSIASALSHIYKVPMQPVSLAKNQMDDTVKLDEIERVLEEDLRVKLKDLGVLPPLDWAEIDRAMYAQKRFEINWRLADGTSGVCPGMRMKKFNKIRHMYGDKGAAIQISQVVAKAIVEKLRACMTARKKQKIDAITEDLLKTLQQEGRQVLQEVYPNFKITKNGWELAVIPPLDTVPLFVNRYLQTIAPDIKSVLSASAAGMPALLDPSQGPEMEESLKVKLLQRYGGQAEKWIHSLGKRKTLHFVNSKEMDKKKKCDMYTRQILQILKEAEETYTSPGTDDFCAAQKRVPGKEGICIVFELYTDSVQAQVYHPLVKGTMETMEGDLNTLVWKTQKYSPVYNRLVKERSQPDRSAAVDWATGLEERVPEGIQIRRCTGDGILFGAGDFEICGIQEKDPPLRHKLKSIPYYKDMEQWKAATADFVQSLIDSYEDFRKSEIIAATKEALDCVDSSFAKRDIVNVLANTDPYMSLEVLTSMLAGDVYKTDYPVYREKELNGRYKEVYTSQELQDMACQLDHKDVIRVTRVQYYSGWVDHDYIRAKSLKAARKADILIDGTYEFSKEDLTRIVKNQERNLTDFEAEYLYKKAKIASNDFTKDLPVQDYLVLIRTLYATGFAAQYCKEIRQYYKGFPDRIKTLARARVESLNHPFTQKLAAEVFA